MVLCASWSANSLLLHNLLKHLIAALAAVMMCDGQLPVLCIESQSSTADAM
jgi:hypothetical protein